jgi:hypothetical protein
VITPEEAAAAATRGLERTDSSRRAARGGRAGTPRLVRTLDAYGHDYFLVPWHDTHGVIAIVQVDAASGETASLVVLPIAVSRLIPTQDDARRAVVTQLRQEPTGEPELVWRPCEETGSPFQPLYRVPLADGEVFVAVSGSIHRTLTPFAEEG